MSNSKASPPDIRQDGPSRLILIEDFETFGANPHEVGIGSLNAAGHEKMPILRAIRRKCIDCSGGNQPEVRKCTVIGCALWPYRLGRNPFSANRGNPRSLIANREGDCDEAPATPEMKDQLP